MKKISIDPITRLEGHGRIDIFLDEEGDVANAYLVVPELRGFEKFAEGRPVEELPRITPRICGVCPEAHHMASAKATTRSITSRYPRRAKSCESCSTLPFTSLTTPSTFTSSERPTLSWGRMPRLPSVISWAWSTRWV